MPPGGFQMRLLRDALRRRLYAPFGFAADDAFVDAIRYLISTSFMKILCLISAECAPARLRDDHDVTNGYFVADILI